MFKSGFVSIIGRPNVGKSTFINQVLGQKISIISPKPQTTRNTIQGIYTTDDAQIIFIDTPGIHKPLHELGEIMNKMSLNTLKEVDLILWIIDSIMDFGTGDEYILNLLKNSNTPVILVVNKVDLAKNKKRLQENIEKFTKDYNFYCVVQISALLGENIDELLQKITQFLPEGPMYYPKDQITNYPEYFIIAEIIREKVLLLLKEEVPHSIAVVVDDIKTEENVENIRATVYVERQSHKKIIIGEKGSMIKQIGTLARKEIVMLLGSKIYLDLWVKVEANWRDKKQVLRRIGYYLENNQSNE